jgi:S1-C subfamily serine protease
LAKGQLSEPGIATAYPCDDAWLAGQDGTVVDLAGWLEAAGLRRSDRLVAIGGISVAASGDWRQALLRARSGEHLELEVERQERVVKLRVACRSNVDWWRAYRGAFEAMADGRWDDCVSYGKKLIAVVRRPFSSVLRIQIECQRAGFTDRRQPAPEEYWKLLHAYTTKLIEESTYRPAGIADRRTMILSMVEALEKSGRQTLADDVRQQLAARESSAQASAKTPAVTPPPVTQASGTAFAVRPDGYLLTALHVVKNATDIEVACPETGKQKAVLGLYSEITDLAVLRTAGGRTPSHLVLAEPKSIQIGQRVFTVGFPATGLLGSNPKYTEGSVSSLSGPGGDASYLQITVPVHSGNSGGPLLNEGGEVVGIVVATAAPLPFLRGTGNLPQNINWALKASLALTLFEQPARLVPDRRAAVERAIKATCL